MNEIYSLPRQYRRYLIGKHQEWLEEEKKGIEEDKKRVERATRKAKKNIRGK